MTLVLKLIIIMKESIWIGVDNQAGDGVWRSITTGEKAPYINWSAGNPNNHASDQHCASLNWPEKGQWDDNQCWKEFTFICEVVGKTPTYLVVFLITLLGGGSAKSQSVNTKTFILYPTKCKGI